MKKLCLFAALIVAASFCLNVESVSAEDSSTAAVLPFKGRNAAKVRSRLYKRLQNANVVLVPIGETSAAYRKTRNYARLSKRLSADRFIVGRVRFAKKKWFIDVEVRNQRGRRLRKLRTVSKKYTGATNQMAVKLVKAGLLPESPPDDSIDWAAEQEPDDQAEQIPPAVAATTAAEPSKPRLVVRRFSGLSSARIRNGVVRSLQKSGSVDFVANNAFSAEAKKLGAKLATEDGHIAPARSLKVDAIVEGDVLREGNRWTAYIRVVDGGSKRVLRQQFYEGRTSAALARIVQRDFASSVSDAYAEVTPPPGSTRLSAREAGKDESESRRVRREKRKSQRRGIGLPDAIDLALYGRLLRRKLAYHDDLRGDLRGYTLGAAPGISIAAQWFPGAHFAGGLPAQFGLDFQYERIFDFKSTRADGLVFPSTSRSFGIGARWRYPLKNVEPQVLLGYGAHSFEVLVAGPPRPGLDNTPQVPSVKYRFFRFGGGLRANIVGDLKLMFEAAYLHIMDAGGIHSAFWFPEAKARGLQGSLLLGYGLPGGLEVRAGIDYRHYFYDLRPVAPNPPWVAGGALDRYLGFSLGLAWRN